MRLTISVWLRLLCVTPLLLSSVVWSNARVVQAAASTTFSGQATAVQATVLGIKTSIADTGPLPSSGGALDASLLNVSAPGVLNADVAHATTIAQADRSESEAALADVNLAVGGNTLGASFLMTQAKAVCGSTAPTASGSAQISNLILNGKPVVVTGAPNQQVSLPNGSVTIDEQTADAPAAGHAGLTVNALHVVVNSVADVIISSAHADVTCPEGVPPNCVGSDFMTGSGSMTTPSGAKANFALAGAFTNGKFWGHLLFINHGNGKQWKSTAITAFRPGSTPTARHMEGTDDENGRAGTFKDDAEDNGPSGNNDSESFQSDDGESDSGHLGEGKMHHHAPCVDDD